MNEQDLSLRLKAANRWRSAYNPLRSLTIGRVVQMLEAGERGMYADLQWTYRLIEKRWATLKALRSRRLSALGKLDWSIKTRDDSPAAQKQAEALRAAYDGLKNFRKAVRFLALASFRGYAHLEKVHENEDASKPVTELRIVDQWFWCRDGVYGTWQYNPDAKQVQTGIAVDLKSFIVREVEDPINEIALVAFLRSNLSQKDWDAFVEVFGIPPLFITLPEGADPEKQAEYQSAADAIVGDMRGTLPAGSEVKTVDAGSRGENPFRDHLKYQDEQLVLAGTGGKLTMLSEATGIGGGATDAHESAFDEIAHDEAADISEILQEQFDAEILAQQFPNQPKLAYFELCAPDEEDLSSLADRAVKLSQAGFDLDPAELSEKFGLKITRKVAVAPTQTQFQRPNPAELDPMMNRELTRERVVKNRATPSASDVQFRDAALREASVAFQKDLKPLSDRIDAIVSLPEDQIDSALRQLREDIQGPLAKKVLRSKAGVDALEKILGTALVTGAVDGAVSRESKK